MACHRLLRNGVQQRKNVAIGSRGAELASRMTSCRPRITPPEGSPTRQMCRLGNELPNVERLTPWCTASLVYHTSSLHEAAGDWTEGHVASVCHDEEQ